MRSGVLMALPTVPFHTYLSFDPCLVNFLVPEELLKLAQAFLIFWSGRSAGVSLRAL